MYSDSSKVCAGCLESYPATAHYFHRYKRSTDGLRSVCRACRATEGRRPLILAQMLASPDLKVCHRCLGALPATTEYFYPGQRGTFGLKAACKECSRADSRRRQQAKRQYYAAKYAEWYARNKQRKREYNARWHQANRERRMLQGKAWRKANPEASRAINANRRVRERVSRGEHSAAEIIQMYEDQQGLCAYCETVLFGDYEVDHMQPISRDGRNDWTNLAIVCQPCNRRKKDKTVLEFLL